MPITKWEPFTGLTPLQREIDRLFAHFLSDRPFNFPERPLAFSDAYTLQPSVEVFESNGDVVVRAEVPGINKKDLTVDITEESLTIKGEVNKESEEKKRNYYLRERHYGSFFRTVPFPVPVNVDKAKAELKDGMLEVHVPKSEKAKAKEVKVEVK